MAQEKDFFETYNLQKTHVEPEVGQTYPIYGAITKILSDTPENVIVEINHSIIAQLNIQTEEQVNLIKERAFEPGVFIGLVESISPSIRINCQTVIFGKKQTQSSN